MKAGTQRISWCASAVATVLGGCAAQTDEDPLLDKSAWVEEEADAVYGPTSLAERPFEDKDTRKNQASKRDLPELEQLVAFAWAGEVTASSTREPVLVITNLKDRVVPVEVKASGNTAAPACSPVKLVIATYDLAPHETLEVPMTLDALVSDTKFSREIIIKVKTGIYERRAGTLYAHRDATGAPVVC